MTFAPVSGASPPADNAQTSTGAQNANAAVGKDAFLQLLVAQIRNQNPLDPADGVEFLSQLAQFSQLEQTMGIREEISGLRSQVDTITATLETNTKTEDTAGDKNV